jgi:rubrerythrin
MGLGDAVDTLGVDQVNGFLDQMQGAITDDDVIEFWRCRKCGHIGALASLEGG